MKAIALKKVLLLIGICAFIGSCTIHKYNNKIVRITPEQKIKLEYLEKNDISLCRLQAFNADGNSKCATVCCEELKFCGVPKAEVIENIKNYRDNNWYLSSPFFSANHIEQEDVATTMLEITNGTWQASDNQSSKPYESAHSFDARFMDIPIEQLENYLCFVRTNPETKKANICRFYYLKYGNDMKLEEYRNKLTLAMVPVYVDTTGATPTREFTDVYKYREGKQTTAILGVGVKCDNSPMANHNHLCPPFKNCVVGTMLYEVDTQL